MIRRYTKLFISALMLIFLCYKAFAESPRKNTPPSDNESSSQELVFKFDPQKRQAQERSFRSGIERLFKNPAIASGFASGSDAINRSVETLMDSVFYSLLDRQIFLPTSTPLRLKVGYERELYSTQRGDYVVVDRFDLGPTYSKKLGSLDRLPINLGIDQRVSVYDIYIRSDGQRIAEQEDRGPLSTFIANWFGLLPLLSLILPPSFDQNEMYDPLRLASTPLVFPVNFEIAKKMPIGSIRSYAISGGVALGTDFFEGLSDSIKESFKNADDLKFSLPLSIVLEGQYQINVLRRSENEVWVGLAKMDGLGFNFASRIGNVLYAFNKVTKFWKGLATPIFPLDLEFKRMMRWNYDHIYSFDLSKNTSRKAFEKAVNGDFRAASALHEKNRTNNVDNGVRFLFTKKSHGPEWTWSLGPNIFLLKSEHESFHADREINQNEPELRRRSIEVESSKKDESWDIFVGSEKVENMHKATIHLEPADEDDIRFSVQAKTPFQLDLYLQIQDRYTEAAEFRDYTNILKYFLDADLAQIPRIPIRDPANLERRKRRHSYMPPHKRELHLHVTPTYLGRFSANAQISFDETSLLTIASASEQSIWGAIARAFDRSNSFVELEVQSHMNSEENSIYLSDANFEELLLDFSYRPLRLMGLRYPWAHAEIEGLRLKKGLQQIQKHRNDPIRLREIFHEMLSQDFPMQSAKALLILAGKDTPRSLSLSSSSKGKLDPKTKDQFSSINDLVVQLGSSDTMTVQASPGELMLQEFEHGNLDIRTSVPEINQIVVRKKPGNSLNLEICVPNADPHKPIRFYLKLDEAQSIDIGRLNFGEQLIKIKPDRDKSPTRCGYEFKLLGAQNSIFDRWTLNRYLSRGGGTFELSISASFDGEFFGNQKNLRFRFEKNLLSMP